MKTKSQTIETIYESWNSLTKSVKLVRGYSGLSFWDSDFEGGKSDSHGLNVTPNPSTMTWSGARKNWLIRRRASSCLYRRHLVSQRRVKFRTGCRWGNGIQSRTISEFLTKTDTFTNNFRCRWVVSWSYRNNILFVIRVASVYMMLRRDLKCTYKHPTLIHNIKPR